MRRKSPATQIALAALTESRQRARDPTGHHCSRNRVPGTHAPEGSPRGGFTGANVALIWPTRIVVPLIALAIPVQVWIDRGPLFGLVAGATFPPMILLGLFASEWLLRPRPPGAANGSRWLVLYRSCR